MSAVGTKKTVVLDVRCLQDSNYATRGVGRHVLALLRGAPFGVRLVGLADPDMPPVVAEAGGLLAAIYPNAYAARFAKRRPQAFVALSPMTHDPLFAALLLSDATILRAAVVYDFIPQHEPERYLPGAVQRLDYATALSWLRRCDLFAPISDSTARELCRLFGTPAHAVAVTGASLDNRFERGSGAAAMTPSHLLVVGGGDARKNPEVVIQAHAQSAELQHRSVPLVVAGNYNLQDAVRFGDLAAQNGGRRDLVRVPGHISDAELVALYAEGFAIVCPSRDEGFSLPVVEGMAAGSLCLASDIPAHQDLVTDAALRFDPRDPAMLVPLLERVVGDPAWRARHVAVQATVWPQFRAAAVAARFWDAVLARIDLRRLAAPSVLRDARPRVALLSPLPPDQSGVADYTAATCPPLAELVDLQVFTETAPLPLLPGGGRVAPMSALAHLLPQFDRVVSVIGNSHLHLKPFELMLRYGSACIAHDARLLGFYRILLGEQRALAVASREMRRPIGAPELNTWLADESTNEALFLGEIAERATPTIVHSPVTAALFTERFGVSPAYVPFSIYRPWTAAELTAASRAAARSRLGLAPGVIAIVTFGFVVPSKGVEECVHALALMRGWGFPASLHFVGSINGLPDKGASLRALIDEIGVSEAVHFAAGFVPEQTYRDFLAGADLGIQLRTYGLGGLSGGLLDCAAAGLPVVTNQSLGEAVGTPASYTSCIPDALSPLLLAQALAGLLEAEPAAARREADRQAFSDERSFRTYARNLCGALGIEVAPGRLQRRRASAGAA